MFHKSSRSTGPGIVLTFVAAAALVVAGGLPAGAVPLAGPITSATTFVAPSLVATGLSGPVGLRFRAAQNDLLVGEQPPGGDVIRIDLSTGLQSTFASFGFGAGPRGLAISPTGDVIVSEVGGAVARLTSTGMLVESSFVPFGSFDAGATFDTLGNLYVVSAGFGVITKFTPAGGQLFASPTIFASGFAIPVEAAFDASGRLFVTVLGAGGGAGPQEAVYQVVPDPGPSIPWATAPDLGATFGPWGLAVDPITGALFVSDFFLGRIAQITAPHVVTEVASGFTMPTGLTFDPAGNLYVAEYNGGGAGQGNVWKLARAATDTAPPTTTAKTSPAPTAKGFNNTSVTVALSAVDNPNPPATGASGVNQIHFSASGAQTIPPSVSPAAGHCTSDGVAACTTSVPITAQGTTSLSYFATDNAGNTEAQHTLVVKIDTTPPEAVNTLNPTTVDAQVAGTDANGATVALTAVIRNDEGELRTYTITDAANNRLILKEQVEREATEAKASIVSLQSCTVTCDAVKTPAPNEKKIEVVTNADGSKQIEQKFVVGSTEVEAEFSSATNQTVIKTEVNGREAARVIRTGLVLLQLVTQSGSVSIAVPS